MFLLSVLACILVLKLTPFGIAISPDSVSYLDAARNIHLGHGIVSTGFLIGGQTFEPFTVWPPLYPILLAVFPGIENNPSFAAVQAMMLTLALSGIFMFLLLRARIGRVLAALAVITFYVSSANLIISTYAWSESLFVCLLLGAIYFGSQAVRLAEQPSRLKLLGVLLLLAMFLAGLFYTRYIGIVFGFLIPLTWLLSANRKNTFHIYLVSGIFYSALVVAWLIRNHLLGDITGGDVGHKARQSSDLSLFDNFDAVFDSLLLLFPNQSWGVLAALFISVLSVIVIRRGLNAGEKQIIRIEDKNLTYLQYALGAAFLVYLIALIVLRSVTNFEAIRIRYIALVSPCLIAVLYIVIYRLIVRIDTTRYAQLLLVPVIATLVLVWIQGGLVFKHGSQNWQEAGTPNYPLTRNSPAMYSHLASPLYVRYFKHIITTLELRADDTVVLQNPKLFHFLTGVDAKKIPSKLNREAVNKINADLNGGYLIFEGENAVKSAMSALDLSPDFVHQNKLYSANALALDIPIDITNVSK
ncbi:hypothetical protein OLMES_1944 [Oleiphilus messinensis]|uniref:Glycosyltransferase RgtA/B/C/D-like domain-containing protein n=2 Tax=Oleiphilus messinensis TaxID=141451 RepID=A0A1Y0I6A1_9GAMM|nr:hypothetical protein OLMES_1944 [Oleiphilus messinensis]